MKKVLVIASCVLALSIPDKTLAAVQQERIRISDDNKGFVYQESGRRFVPWGVNYDHDADGRLIEDYWADEWETVESDFGEISQLGANAVRIHLQFGKFMEAADRPSRVAMERLERLIRLAESKSLYLKLTGLGCYHKQDVPAWYVGLEEQERWKSQACFWEAVAKCCAGSNALFCYDLMNEPVIGGEEKSAEWLGPPFAGKHFVQFVARETAGRQRHEIAKAWIDQMVAAIRKHDKGHLVTVGLVPWSLDRPGLTSGFIPDKVSGSLDFLSVHIYPESGKQDEARSTLAGFSIGKPVVIGEIFPLQCTARELDEFIESSREVASGWFGFYWGKSAAEYRLGESVHDAIMVGWLELFSSKSQTIGKHND